MGFLDDLTGAVDRGVSAVGRTTKSAQLKMQVSDLGKRRRDLAAQLGANLYEATKDDASMRAGREALYDGIASIDRQCAELNTQIKAIEQAVSKPSMANITITCPRCKTAIGSEDLFCHGCGMPADEARSIVAPVATPISLASQISSTSANSKCPKCGAPISDSDSFCMNCGLNLAENTNSSVSDAATEDFSPNR